VIEPTSFWEALKPSLRSLKYKCLEETARIQANLPLPKRPPKPIAFIIGCGRSGTTLLGQILSHHLQVRYLFEPYHLWTAIDPRTDALNLFHSIDAKLLMDGADANPLSQHRFDRLIRSAARPQTQLIVEKTPLNALRIGYLEALAPGSKFVHLVRDGVEVCHSIDKLARTNTYKIAGKPNLNQWWGNDDAKWRTMLHDGIAAGYCADEAHLIDVSSRGAYEWLLSLGEIDRWQATLGNRLQTIPYNVLTTDPKRVLQELCEFLQLDIPNTWLEAAIAKIQPPKPAPSLSLSLPPKLCEAFNAYQKRYGFPHRAECDRAILEA
jgi:Sulfotransferase family